MARWADGPSRYGWISIALHWLSAAAILALLFIGGSMQPGKPEPQLPLHSSVALTAYALLIARIVWRVRQGHPQRLPRQGPRAYALGRWFHHGLLLALAVMLISGPAAAWAGGLPLDLWSWRLPALFGSQPRLFAIAQQAHYLAANCLGWGVLIHIVAVVKHIAIDRDGAFERILFPSVRNSTGGQGSVGATRPDPRFPRD